MLDIFGIINSPMWALDCNVIYSINEKLLLTKYLYYILKSQQNIIYQKQAGSGQPTSRLFERFRGFTNSYPAS